MPLITTDTGSINLPNKSAKVLLWYMPPAASTFKETVIAGAARDTACDQVAKAGAWTQGRPAVVDTVNGVSVPRDMAAFGKFSSGTYQVSDGTFLKLFLFRRAPFESSTGVPLWQARLAAQVGTSGSLIYRVREGAAVVSLTVAMIDDQRCPTRVATIVGPLERMTLAQAEAAGMKRVVDTWRKSFDLETVAALVRSTEIRPATTTTATVAKVDGTTAVIIAPTRRRRQIET